MYNKNSNIFLFLIGLAVGSVLMHKMKKKNWTEEKLDEVKDTASDAYNKVVDEVTDKYARAKGISQNELKDLTEDLKKHWFHSSAGLFDIQVW